MGGRHVGRPERHGSVLVTEVDDGILRVDFEDRAGSEARLVSCYRLTGGRVGVLKEARLADRSEEEVIGKEGHAKGLNVVLEFTVVCEATKERQRTVVMRS